MRVCAIVGPSGSGKTTLITQLVSAYSDAGVECGCIKHEAHRVELDSEGKDSWRMREAGSVATLLVADDQYAWFGRPPDRPSLDELLRPFAGIADVILVEGYRSQHLPSIVVGTERDPTWTQPDPSTVLMTIEALNGNNHPPSTVSAVQDAINALTQTAP